MRERLSLEMSSRSSAGEERGEMEVVEETAAAAAAESVEEEER
jgi:hypothetical protein